MHPKSANLQVCHQAKVAELCEAARGVREHKLPQRICQLSTVAAAAAAAAATTAADTSSTSSSRKNNSGRNFSRDRANTTSKFSHFSRQLCTQKRGKMKKRGKKRLLELESKEYRDFT